MGTANLLSKVTNTIALGALALVFAAGCSPQNASLSNGVELTKFNTGIIGGTEATGEEDFSKSVVSLINVVGGSLCTASIISQNTLVTAAHCVDGPVSSIKVVFGKDIHDRESVEVRNVTRYQVSPLWATRSDEITNAGDIAVVEFSGGLPTGYKPAQVLANPAALQTGGTVLLAGFGISDGEGKTGSGTLRSVEVKILDSKFSESEILIDQAEGKGACHGDSGGPAFVKVGNVWALWGVTNRGINDPDDKCSVSAAYASVPFYKDWIATVTQKWAATPVTRTVAGF